MVSILQWLNDSVDWAPRLEAELSCDLFVLLPPSDEPVESRIDVAVWHFVKDLVHLLVTGDPLPLRVLISESPRPAVVSADTSTLGDGEGSVRTVLLKLSILRMDVFVIMN